jgi:redox-sensitive bicupin YhaK (pirin superfamily)
MRKILKIHQAVYEPIAGLETYRALPTSSLKLIDPFLFLNHHGPQVYPPNNRGLPFGPHPHGGFEMVTFIIEGDIFHLDSGGNHGTILPGGVQWMTTGSGLIHSEESSESFRKNGGKLEFLQLWVNLPSRHKMVKPSYINLPKENIPIVKESGSDVLVHVVSGAWHGTEGAYQSISDVHLSLVEMKKGSTFSIIISPGRNIFFYVIRGKVLVNDELVELMQLAEFEKDQDKIKVQAKEDSLILIGHALPFKEPVVSLGPFVMNSHEEIRQAFADYKAGKMGVLREELV